MKLQTLVFAIFTWVFFPIPGQAQAHTPTVNPAAASGQAPASNITPAADSSAPKDYLSSKWKQANFSLTQTGLDNWRQQQKKTWEEKIAALPDSVKARLTDRADKALSYTWPALPASLYLEYKMNGNRSHFEQRQNERRAALSSLVIGELVTRDKKYLPQIVNGIWATLEESTWVLPAHIGMQRGGTGLPDPQEAIIDLFDGETAASLSAMRFMLEEELQQYSPVIGQRIGYELDKRVFLPYLQRTDFWWMGFGDRRPNNWNPWINSNVLSAVLLSGQHIDTIGRLLQKILSSTDKFIDGYGDDGGCDEGPSYWSEAGGKLIRILYLMQCISDGRLDWSDKPLLHKIGSYVIRTHIAGSYFVNFADAPARTIPNPESVYRFGNYFKDDSLRYFAAYLADLQRHALPGNNVNDFLFSTGVFGQLESASALAPDPALSWLPQVEVLTARSAAGSEKGLFVAIQGGNNGESHNHNDVGNFIIYKDGQPVIVDAGVGTYTATTFSSRRYTLWNMQSQWHNCPTINGVQQQDGSRFRATELSFRDSQDKTARPGKAAPEMAAPSDKAIGPDKAASRKAAIRLQMDIATAYPAAAAVKSWIRSFSFDPGRQELQLEDRYELTEWKDSSRIHFLTCARVEQRKEGELVLLDKEGVRQLTLLYDPSRLTIEIESKPMDDERLRQSWGNALTRITAVVRNKENRQQLHFTFR